MTLLIGTLVQRLGGHTWRRARVSSPSYGAVLMLAGPMRVRAAGKGVGHPRGDARQ
eukprot:SAG31_NODE_4607_length_3098_cov_4.930310_4_plen_56_part_00